MKCRNSILPGYTGYTILELLTVISVIGILFFAYPSIVWTIGSAKDATIRWQENALNNTYRQYLASGGPEANSKEEALAILATHPSFQIEPKETLPSSQGTVQLAFEEQLFAYEGGEEAVLLRSASVNETSAVVDDRKETAFAPLVLDVKSSGGTASYGGQDFGVGAMPTFMLSGSNNTFQLHNSGGYENIPSWHSLSEFVSDLPPSQDRFNPSATKVLSLEKDGKRYDLTFCTWDSGNRLRLISVALFE